MAVTTTNLGVITAYGDAVAAGYTGTKAEWQTLMASYATVGQQAVDAKNDAVAAKDTAVSKATEATTAANTATTKANEASASAQSIAQSASQIAQNTSDISELKEDLTHKANTDGYYADLVSGGSTQLLSDMVATDTTPYNYRTAGGSLEIGDREKLKKIVGGTVNWNQLADLNSPLTQTWAEDTSTYYGNMGLTNHPFDLISGHKYAVCFDVERTISSNDAIGVAFGAANSGVLVTYDNGESNGKKWSIRACSNTWLSTVGISYSNYNGKKGFSSGDYVTVKSTMLFDLTVMFGSTIADYIYSLETATAGAGVAWFRKLFPKDYYAYDAGSLQSVQAAKHVTVGFNQWDEEWEQGYISNTGELQNNGYYFRSKNYIPIFPETTYFYKCPADYSDYARFAFYDADKRFLSYVGTSSYIDWTFTTPANAHYMKFTTGEKLNKSGVSYRGDICINLHWDGERDGEYEPYEEHSYPIDSDVTLRGIPKLDANNNLYYDGDEYVTDGTVTRKYGIVDLGTLNWTRTADGASGYYFISENMPTLKKEADNYAVWPNLIMGGGYSKVASATIALGTATDKTYGGHDSGAIRIKDTSYTDAATFKAAMSGVMLVYELATPTTESADPYTEIQNVSNCGTEEFVTTSLVPVGHETAYQPDLRAKIEVAPESPDTDGLYLMKRENGQNSYVAYLGELPSDPTTDGTYTLKCTVASGTATKTWEADT